MYRCLFLPWFLFKIQQAERLVWLVQERGWSVPKSGVTLNHDKFNSLKKKKHFNTTITIVNAVFVSYANIRGELIRCGSFPESLSCAGRYNAKALSTHTVQHQQSF